MKIVTPIAIAIALAATARARGLTVDDMLAMQRVSEPAVSPDGKLVAFTVRDTDVEGNRGRTDVWLAAVDGSSTKRLTTHPDNDSSPAWSPAGRWIYFVSARGGSSQVWRIAAGGGEAEPVTRLPVDVGGFKLLPDGEHLIVALEVWPDAPSLAESVKQDEARAKAKVKARAYDQLLFRHWDQWEDGKFSHLFVWSSPAVGGKADDARDLTPRLATDVPTHPFGGMEEIDVSPDGKSVVYVARVAGRENAWRTNTDVFLTTTDGRGKPVDLTAGNLAYEFDPTFSPDGRSIAYRMMTRPGYESDRARIAIIDVATRRVRALTEAWDRSVDSIAWSSDGKSLLATADDLGHRGLFSVDATTGAPRAIVASGSCASPHAAGDRVLFAKDTLVQPTELFTVRSDGSEPRQITHLNDERVRRIAWGEVEPFTFTGARGDTVHGYVVKPSGFAAGGKYPVAMIVHGGPQGSMGDHFHYRWNPEVFAGHGYGVVFIDFHGSTGYGQAFTDAINHDWGGAPYDDLMAGVDAALKKYAWLDGTRMAALGASFGGYMINWINGRTDRFRALVCHDGNLDERMAYFNTEELWFPEWEHGGVPWEKPEGYTAQNPIDRIASWKTPTLVIHGGNDYRIVDTQGMATFTALQRRGVPSRLLHFPDENHWVLKPQNSKLWHDEVLAWLDRWLAKR